MEEMQEQEEVVFIQQENIYYIFTYKKLPKIIIPINTNGII